MCLAWSLCSVVLFMFASFNESIQQTLVPTAESQDAAPLRVDPGVQFTLLGYTGPCIAGPTGEGSVHSLQYSGLECDSVEIPEVTCGGDTGAYGYLEVKWAGSNCIVSAAVFEFKIKPEDYTEQVSTAGIAWQTSS